MITQIAHCVTRIMTEVNNPPDPISSIMYVFHRYHATSLDDIQNMRKVADALGLHNCFSGDARQLRDAFYHTLQNHLDSDTRNHMNSIIRTTIRF